MQTDKVIVKVILRKGPTTVNKLIEVQRNTSFSDAIATVKSTFQIDGVSELLYIDEQQDCVLMDSDRDLQLYFKQTTSNYRWECTENVTKQPPVVVAPPLIVNPPPPIAMRKITVNYQNMDVRQKNVQKIAMPKLNARFVKHVTCDDESSTYGPGDRFFKTWRFRNDGGLKWPTMIQLLFVSKLTGDSMGGPEELPVFFPEQIEIGREIDISVPLIAPQRPGEYTGFWKLADETGKKFGQRVRVRIHVAELDPHSTLNEQQKAMLQELEESGFQASNTIKTIVTRKTPPKTLDEIEKELQRLGIRQSLN